jgi:hypothetical protein
MFGLCKTNAADLNLGVGGVIHFHEILQQICENLEGWGVGGQG